MSFAVTTMSNEQLGVLLRYNYIIVKASLLEGFVYILPRVPPQTKILAVWVETENDQFEYKK